MIWIIIKLNMFTVVIYTLETWIVANLVFIVIVTVKWTIIYDLVVPPVLEQQTPPQRELPSYLLPSIKQLLPALHTRHGVHVLTPVSHFLFLWDEKKTLNQLILSKVYELVATLRKRVYSVGDIENTNFLCIF